MHGWRRCGFKHGAVRAAAGRHSASHRQCSHQCQRTYWPIACKVSMELRQRSPCVGVDLTKEDGRVPLELNHETNIAPGITQYTPGDRPQHAGEREHDMQRALYTCGASRCGGGGSCQTSCCLVQSPRELVCAPQRSCKHAGCPHARALARSKCDIDVPHLKGPALRVAPPSGRDPF